MDELVLPWRKRLRNPSRIGSWIFPRRTDTPFATRADDAIVSGSTLLEPPRTFGGGVSLREAAEAAVRRVLTSAAGAVRACRDARAATRPEIGREFSLDLVNQRRRSRYPRARGALGDRADRVLERCIEGVVKSLPFFAAGAVMNVQHRLTVPESRSTRRTQCSAASKVSLPLRKMIWRARRGSGERFSDTYLLLRALVSCPRGRIDAPCCSFYLEGPLRPRNLAANGRGPRGGRRG